MNHPRFAAWLCSAAALVGKELGLTTGDLVDILRAVAHK